MTLYSIERSLSSEIRSSGRSALLYFCVALIGAVGLSVAEQYTKEIKAEQEIGSSPKQDSDSPPAEDKNFEKTIGPEVRVVPPPTSQEAFRQSQSRETSEILTHPTKQEHVDASPFAGFDGAWSGSGTVVLVNGSTETIRCKAVFKVNGGGLRLKQNLICASDSYKFDLSSDVTSQGDRISGNWSEASRNIFGNLRGKAGDGQMELAVETAAGDLNYLTFTAKGNQQKIAIRATQGQNPGIAAFLGGNVTLWR